MLHRWLLSFLSLSLALVAAQISANLDPFTDLETGMPQAFSADRRRSFAIIRNLESLLEPDTAYF
jgi:hypothetical protein